MSRAKGHAVEVKVKDYLKHKGLVWITENYTTPLGEIDLIFQDEDCLVFVEVRMRKNTLYGDAVESITRSKQMKLIKTAEHYLVHHRKYAKMACRFDVVCVDGQNALSWIKNAFSA